MINKSMLQVLGEKPEQNILFHSSENHELFYILLVDFLSPMDSSLIQLSKRNTPLSNLDQIMSQNILGLQITDEMLIAYKTLKNWLEEKKEIEIWLPILDKEATISLSRLEMIKTCGSITKHGSGRLNINFENLLLIFQRTNQEISKEDILLEYKKFYDRFHNDILLYHSSYLVEMMINIRWQLYNYLYPLYEKINNNSDNKKLATIRRRSPDAIESVFMEIIFDELMNRVSREPYIQQIQTTKYLRLRY